MQLHEKAAEKVMLRALDHDGPIPDLLRDAARSDEELLHLAAAWRELDFATRSAADRGDRDRRATVEDSCRPMVEKVAFARAREVAAQAIEDAPLTLNDQESPEWATSVSNALEAANVDT